MKNEKIKLANVKKSKKLDNFDFVRMKINKFKNMITDTILAIQNYKIMDIVSASELNVCIQALEVLYEDLDNIVLLLASSENIETIDEIIGKLQRLSTN